MPCEVSGRKLNRTFGLRPLPGPAPRLATHLRLPCWHRGGCAKVSRYTLTARPFLALASPSHASQRRNGRVAT